MLEFPSATDDHGTSLSILGTKKALIQT